MKFRIPSVLRYTTIHKIEFGSSWVTRFLFRLCLLFALAVALSPWSVIREIVFRKSASPLNLMYSARATIWIWNRSWIPVKFLLGTYFEIGWVLSAGGCKRLLERGFVSKIELFKSVDRAQLLLSELKELVLKGDSAGIQAVDQEIACLVETGIQGAIDALEQSTQENSLDDERETHVGPSSISFDNDGTAKAVLAFDELCKALSQRYFLVSGTFLGAIRHGRPLAHDHDIDIGIFSYELRTDFISQLNDSPNFIVTTVETLFERKAENGSIVYSVHKTPTLVRAVHKTGVVFDVFIHFCDGETSWHGTSYQRWDNSNFELTCRPFVGISCLTPSDHERYLTENYGPDWRIPKKDYDTNLDTPNMRFQKSANALVFWAWLIAQLANKNQRSKVCKYVDMLSSLGVIKSIHGRIRLV